MREAITPPYPSRESYGLSLYWTYAPARGYFIFLLHISNDEWYINAAEGWNARISRCSYFTTQGRRARSKMPTGPARATVSWRACQDWYIPGAGRGLSATQPRSIMSMLIIFDDASPLYMTPIIALAMLRYHCRCDDAAERECCHGLLLAGTPPRRIEFRWELPLEYYARVASRLLSRFRDIWH